MWVEIESIENPKTDSKLPTLSFIAHITRMEDLLEKLQKVLLFAIDLLFSLFWFPFMLILISPLLIYKSIVTLLASCMRPDLIPLPTKDQFMAWDLVIPKKPGERFVYNLGFSIRVCARVRVDSVKNKYKKMVAGKYPRMEQTLELFGGYAFRRKAKNINLDHMIREVDLGTKSMNTFEAEWTSQGFLEDSPAWEIVMIPLHEAQETYILLKVHHSSADAYSLIHFINTFLDNDIPILPKSPEETGWEMFLNIITCPRVSLLLSLDTLKSSLAPLPWATSNSNRSEAIFQSSTALSMTDIKRIQQKTGFGYVAISLTLFGGVLSRIISDSAQEKTDSKNNNSIKLNNNRSTYVQVSLPLPNHPLSEMCNHWTSGAIRVPLGTMKPSERLKANEENYILYHKRGLDKLMHRVLFPPGSLIPTRIFPWVYESIRRLSALGALFTTVIGYQDDFYTFEGHPVVSVSPLYGMLGLTPVVTALGFSYHERYEITMIATEQVAESQAAMEKIVGKYLAEELANLLQDIQS